MYYLAKFIYVILRRGKSSYIEIYELYSGVPFHFVVVAFILSAVGLLKSPLRCNQLLNAIEATAPCPPNTNPNPNSNPLSRTEYDAAKQKPLRWKLFNEAFVSRTKPLTISCLLGMSVSYSVCMSVPLSVCLSLCLSHCLCSVLC